MSAPPHLILDPEDYTDHDLGPLNTGKEAEVFVIERTAPDGPQCLLAHKRYRPRRVTHKGELEPLGFQRASTFVNDAGYRDGRVIGNSRDRRAVARGSTPGARCMLAAGVVHADLSVYNVLWFEDRPWMIDVPQAVEVSAHAQALDLLRRDLGNVAPWFQRRGVAFDPDPDSVFVDLLAWAYR